MDTDPTSSVKLPVGWFPVDREGAVALDAELRREMPRYHQLHGRNVRAVARRLDQDDVLYHSEDDNSIFLVHLTWRVERDPAWPWTVRYDSIRDFCERWPREQLENSGDTD
jgi:hypothetical protein